MRITHRDGIYIAIATVTEREALAKAGFVFHYGNECPAGPQTCLACRVKFMRGWWTRRTVVAVRLSAYADDFAKKALAPHMRAVEASRATDADIAIPHPPGESYLGYQKAGIAFIAQRDPSKILLGDAPGLGKTITSLGFVNLKQNIKSVIIICPASLRINWTREARKWLVQDGRKWRYHVVDEDEALPEDANFVVANYNRIVLNYKPCEGSCTGEKRKELPCPGCNGTGNGPQHPLICSTCAGKKHVYCTTCRGRGKVPGSNIKIVESIWKRQYDLLVVDEAHFIKNLQARRTRAVLGDRFRKKPGLVDLSRHVLFLTGTPIPNRPIEIWPLLSILSPEEFGDQRRFSKRYCGGYEEKVGKNKKQWKADGATHLEELQERLRSTVLIRRLKEEVLKDLPPKRRQIISLIPTEKARKIIAEELELWDQKFGAEIELLEEAVTSIDKSDKATYDQAVNRLQYIQRVAFMEMARVRHDVAVAKLPNIIEHLQSLWSEGVDKVICFAHHHDVIDTLAEKFGSKAVALSGKVTDKDKRQSLIDAFQKEERVKLFIGSTLAAGTGITLTASSHVVFAELDWSPANVTQAEDRSHRIGQKNSVLIQHLVLDGSLDARMAQILVEKQDIADRALDKSTDVAVKGLVAAPRPESAVEAVPMWKKLLLKEAMTTISGHFTQHDALIGKKLAELTEEFSDRQAHLAFKFTKKYKSLISIEIAKQLGIWEPPSPAELRRQQREELRKQLSTRKKPVVVEEPSLMDIIEKKVLRS